MLWNSRLISANSRHSWESKRNSPIRYQKTAMPDRHLVVQNLVVSAILNKKYINLKLTSTKSSNNALKSIEHYIINQPTKTE